MRFTRHSTNNGQHATCDLQQATCGLIEVLSLIYHPILKVLRHSMHALHCHKSAENDLSSNQVFCSSDSLRNSPVFLLVREQSYLDGDVQSRNVSVRIQLFGRAPKNLVIFQKTGVGNSRGCSVCQRSGSSDHGGGRSNSSCEASPP